MVANELQRGKITACDIASLPGGMEGLVRVPEPNDSDIDQSEQKIGNNGKGNTNRVFRIQFRKGGRPAGMKYQQADDQDHLVS